ncbi:MAG: hypothetical protein CVT84_06050 [Alphaproteobacteria bacterium HGW-Alphaproteobacteria-6]|nr:MAG: hypothetical protein CVT84_06050 [Alphaproteobacteria bacterium HGW-Alphaproteobacteria-6]
MTMGPAGTNTAGGAAAGALLGGVIGATSGGDERLTKAAAGAVVGGLIGGAIGSQLDKQAAELERDINNNQVRIVNTGSALIVTMPDGILFATDSAQVSASIQNDLFALADNLNRYPSSQVEIIGHTDNTGSAAYNQDLSQRRAAAVASVLRSAGVPGGRLVSYGRGESQPIASNLTVQGRAQNRRVEIVITPNR